MQLTCGSLNIFPKDRSNIQFVTSYLKQVTLQPLPEDDFVEFFNCRWFLAALQPKLQGTWSRRRAQAIIDFNAHCPRNHNAVQWYNALQRVWDARALAARRAQFVASLMSVLANSWSCLAGRTDTRCRPGSVTKVFINVICITYLGTATGRHWPFFVASFAFFYILLLFDSASQCACANKLLEFVIVNGNFKRPLKTRQPKTRYFQQITQTCNFNVILRPNLKGELTRQFIKVTFKQVA